MADTLQSASPDKKWNKNKETMEMTGELEHSQSMGKLSKTKTIGKKKDLVMAVRDANPATCNPAGGIFWQVEGNLKTTTIDAGGVKQQLAIVENGVNYSAKRFNDLKVANNRATHELKAKLDELEVQKKAWEDLHAMKNAETEEGRRIDQLKADIDTVNADIKRKEHYTRQLEYVLQRLRRNQIKFDAHMNGMEDALRAIDKEAREVKLLRRGLDSGLARAVHVEEETRARLSMSTKERHVLLEARRGEMKNAEMLQVWLANRDQAKMDLALQLRGDLSKDEEMLLINQLREKQDKTRNLQRANEESHKKLQQMEDEFMLIKQVTGVSSLDDILEKVSSQKPNKANLESEVKDAEMKLAAAKKDTMELEARFQDLKSSGVGAADMSRETVNQMESDINSARQEFKITHALSERLNGVLVGLQQGGNGLLQRVQPYMHMAEAGVFELTQAEDEPWAESMYALSTAEQVLAKMMELCAVGDSSPNKLNNMDDEEDETMDGTRDRSALDTLDSGPCFANNIRIISKKHLRESEFGTDADEEGGAAGGKTNEGVAEGLAAVLAAVGAVGADSITDETIEGGGPTMGRGQGQGKSGGAGATPAGMVDDGTEDYVPSRVGVKKKSGKSCADAVRKKELELRRKKLAESMAGAIDNSGIGNVARSRSQLQSAARLSTIYHPPTLPEGVTLRDDPMTKTKAFLTHLPDLI